jgi:endonuclease YncB( thermonuclease family)
MLPEKQRRNLLSPKLYFVRLQLIALVACILCLSACSDDALRGRVVKVADGDTITILDSANTQHKIRLQGIDAPEKGQAFGKASGRFLSGLVAGRDVRVTYAKRDQYNRILGTVYLDDRDINLEMLKAGMAWHYKRFDKSPAYAAAEQDARENRRGLWSDPNPIPPEQFRHGVPSPSAAPGGTRSVASAPTARIEYCAGKQLPISSRTPAPVNATWPDTGYWLSTNSNKRHNRNCENYRKTRGYPCQKNEGERCGKCGG